MNRGTIKGWTAMTLLGLLAGAANADDEAVRISDSPPPGMKADLVQGTAAPSVPVTAAPASSECDNGTVEGGVGVGIGGAVGIYRIGDSLRNIIAYNPARGFRPPTTVPIEREAIMYNNYWPAKWYGQPGWKLAPSYPMVYMPTDTTQLGVYYARVPQWQPNPRMYPQPPRPDQWNRRVVSADLAGGGGCYGGVPTGYTQPTPAGSPTPDTMGAPVTQPAPSGQPAPQMMTIPPAPKMAPPPAPQGN